MADTTPAGSALIGTKVRLGPNHPHARKVGVVTAIDIVDGDIAVKVRLDECYMGECYAFPGDWEVSR